MTPVDGVYGVIDSGVQDRKAARGMHGCRLGTGSANNHEKRYVLLDNRIDRVGRGLLRILWLIMERSGITTGDLCRKTRAEKHQCDHILWHRDYSFLFFSKHSMVRHAIDRKSTRLNSSHGYISYAVFCLKKKNFILILYPSTFHRNY